MSLSSITLNRLRLLLIFQLVLLCRTGVVAQQIEPGLFDNDDLLQITLSGNIHKLLNDRSEKAEYQSLRLGYDALGKSMEVPVKVKTRGHFRLSKQNCIHPPLMLNFSSNDTSASTLFSGLNKIKLVTPCRAEKLVVHEYLVYKLYNQVTEKSLKAKLVKVSFRDTVKSREMAPVYGILLEEDNMMAKRHHGKVIENTLIQPDQTQPQDFLRMAVFEYLIGNTDWSVQYQQNVKLLSFDSAARACAVAYDFDHAGIVRAPYAKPAPELDLPSTLIRRYRGYCMENMMGFQEVFTYFNSIREQLYNVYRQCPMIDEGYRKATIKYLDDFYVTINDPKKSAAEFMYPCDKGGTGNVVIKGLRK